MWGAWLNKRVILSFFDGRFKSFRSAPPHPNFARGFRVPKRATIHLEHNVITIMSKKKNKTTKHHFKIFKHQVQDMVELLGLKEYELDLRHEALNARADISVTEGVLATIRLSTDWHRCKVTDHGVAESAKHEVLHLLLHRLMLVSGERYASEEEIDRVEHDIVYRLEKVL